MDDSILDTDRKDARLAIAVVAMHAMISRGFFDRDDLGNLDPAGLGQEAVRIANGLIEAHEAAPLPKAPNS